MDPYRDSAEPLRKKLIIKTWKVDTSAFVFAVLVAALVGAGPSFAIRLYRDATACEEMVKIIASDNDDRHCRNGSHMVIERMNDQHVLVRCVCDTTAAPR